MRDQWKCGLAHGKNSYFPARSLVEHKNLNSQDSKGSKPAEFSQQLWGGLVPSASPQEGAGEGAEWYFKKLCDGCVSCISLLMLTKVSLSHEQTMISRDLLRSWRLIKLREMTIYDQNGFHLHFVRPSIDFTFQLWTARGQLWPMKGASNEPGSQ